MTPHKGEVYDYSDLRWVVVSGDAANVDLVWLAQIIRRHPGDQPDALVVDLHDADPVTGSVVLLSMMPVTGANLGEPITMVVGVTLDRINDALRNLFDL